MNISLHSEFDSDVGFILCSWYELKDFQSEVVTSWYGTLAPFDDVKVKKTSHKLPNTL